MGEWVIIVNFFIVITIGAISVQFGQLLIHHIDGLLVMFTGRGERDERLWSQSEIKARVKLRDIGILFKLLGWLIIIGAFVFTIVYALING